MNDNDSVASPMRANRLIRIAQNQQATNTTFGSVPDDTYED